MADTHKLDLKLKRLRAIERDFRARIKRAEADCKGNFIPRKKYLKIKKGCELKIERLLPKIRRLRHIRNEMKARGS